jgi:hypothetical protein
MRVVVLAPAKNASDYNRDTVLVADQTPHENDPHAGA